MLNIVINSKKVTPGVTFIPIVGEVHDGHKFIPDAVSSGAKKVYYSSTDPTLDQFISGQPDVEWVKVQDTTQLLGELAAAHIDEMKRLHGLKVVAITGSVGKTTTKDILGQLLSHFGETVFPKESFNNEIGVPLTVFAVNDTTEYLVLEIGANHIGEIESLTQIAQPDVAVLLKAGVAHEGEFGGEDVIVKEKAKIFASSPVLGIIQADDANSETLFNLARGMSAATRFEGLSAKNAENIVLDEFERLSFDFKGQHFCTNFSGRHQIYNVLAALQVMLSGVLLDKVEDIATLAPIIAKISPIAEHRMQVKQFASGVAIIDDAYNANPDSMRAAVDALLNMSRRDGKKSVAVLGDMLELGENSAKLHAEVGLYAIEQGVDEIWTIGEEAEHYADLLDAKQRARVRNYNEAVRNPEKLCTLTAPNVTANSENKNVVYLLKASSSLKLWEKVEELKR